LQPPETTTTDFVRRSTLVSFTHPLAAAIVVLVACLVGYRPYAIGVPEHDHALRLFPFASRLDARVGASAVTLAALLVTVFARGRAGRRLRRGLGAVGIAALGFGAFVLIRNIRSDCHRWQGCDFWHVPLFWIAGVLALLAPLSLLVWARREPGPRLRWVGLGVLLALAIASAGWTYRATRVRQRYTGAELSGVHLRGYFESNHENFVPSVPPEGGPAEPVEQEGRIPPAVPAMPMQGATMICGGDWRVVKFPDRDRCLPRRPLVAIEPGDVEAITVASPYVGDTPSLELRLTSDAGRRFATALRTVGSFHIVLLNARDELIMDTAAPYPVPGPAFAIRPGKMGAPETERLLRLILDRR
jgi:hypothetical protein